LGVAKKTKKPAKRKSKGKAEKRDFSQIALLIFEKVTGSKPLKKVKDLCFKSRCL